MDIGCPAGNTKGIDPSRRYSQPQPPSFRGVPPGASPESISPSNAAPWIPGSRQEARPGMTVLGIVPRMLRSAPRLRRGALLIRGPWLGNGSGGSRFCTAAPCAAVRPGHEVITRPKTAPRRGGRDARPASCRDRSTPRARRRPKARPSAAGGHIRSVQ
jgi:hypothetical protein